MAISKEAKKLFDEKIRPYKEFLSEVDSSMSHLDSLSKKHQNVRPYIQVKSAVLCIQRANTYVLMNRLSVETHKVKNDTYLNEARKHISNSLNDLLKIVGDDIETPLTENKENQEKFEKLKPGAVLNLLKGYHDALLSINADLGSNNKWRWSFPDLHYKVAVIGRNLFDFRAYEAAKDPNYENYVELQELIRFIVEEAQFAAQEFRSRYELATNDAGDLQMVSRLLSAIKQIYRLTGNKEELEKISTALEANDQKIEVLLAAKKKKKG